MPVLNSLVHKFLQRRNQDVLMFGHVNGVRKNLPTVTVEKAIRNFFDLYDIDEAEWSFETALRTYHRMMDELKKYEVQRDHTKLPG